MWLGLSGDQHSSRNYSRLSLCSKLESPTQNKRLSYRFRKLQRCYKLCVRNEGQRPNAKTEDAHSALITQEITKVSEAICQKSAKDQILKQKMFIVLLSLRRLKGVRSSMIKIKSRDQCMFFIISEAGTFFLYCLSSYQSNSDSVKLVGDFLDYSLPNDFIFISVDTLVFIKTC